MVTIPADLIPLVNFVLATAILVLGLWGYRKSGRKTEALVGAAFGLFAFTHLLVLLGFELDRAPDPRRPDRRVPRRDVRDVPGGLRPHLWLTIPFYPPRGLA